MTVVGHLVQRSRAQRSASPSVIPLGGDRCIIRGCGMTREEIAKEANMAKKRTANDFPHKKLAKITSTMLGFEGHGILTAMIHVDYGEGVAQGLGGWALDEWSEKHSRRVGHVLCGEFVAGVLRACGVETWEKLKGRTIYALFESDAWSALAIGIAPLPTEEGEVFIFKEIVEEAVARSKA